MKEKGRNMWTQKRIWAWFYYLNLHQGNYLYGLWTDKAAWYKSVESKLQESDWAKLPPLCLRGGFPCGSAVKHLPVMQEMQELWVWLPSQEDPLEEGMTTQSSFLAWRMPWTEKPGRLQSIGLQRVGHDWSNWVPMHVCLGGGFPCGSVVKHLPVMQEMQELWVWWFSQKDPLEEGMTTHSSFLAWRMPWTEKPGRLQSIGLQRVGHDWSNWVPMHVCLGMHGYRVLQKVCSTPELHPDSLQDFFIFSKMNIHKK